MVKYDPARGRDPASPEPDTLSRAIWMARAASGALSKVDDMRRYHSDVGNEDEAMACLSMIEYHIGQLEEALDKLRAAYRKPVQGSIWFEEPD